MLESTSVQYEYVWPGVANSLGCFLLFEHEPEACRRDAVSKTDVLDRCKSCREDVSGVQRGVLNTSGMKKIGPGMNTSRHARTRAEIGDGSRKVGIKGSYR